MFLPYIGFNSFVGNNELDAGFRIGGMMGFRIGDYVSLNGELTIDSINPNSNFIDGSTYSEFDFGLTFSPMVHIPAGTVELAFGPKLGGWLGVGNQSAGAVPGEYDFAGGDLGLNAALFFQVGRRVWLGGLFSFDSRTYSSSCFTPTYGSQACQSVLPSSDKVTSASFALML
jgi:hypothetical protein